MPSAALTSWTTSRAARLDKLVAARQLVTGGRYPTQTINWSLVLVLASEFQGFTRELHGEAAGILAASAARGNAVHFEIIRNNLLAHRALDRSNARMETLNEDFNRLGVDIWKEITNSVVSGTRWKQQLRLLNEARNAIAHNNLGRIRKMRDDGHPVNSSTINSWRTACNGIGRHLDLALEKHLKSITGAQPW